MEENTEEISIEKEEFEISRDSQMTGEIRLFEESEILGNLSFSKPGNAECEKEERMAELDFNMFQTYEVAKMPESPPFNSTPCEKFIQKNVLNETGNLKSPSKMKLSPSRKLNPSKKLGISRKVTSKEDQIASKRFRWNLEDSFRKFLKEKLGMESAEKLVRHRVEVISEFQVQIEALTDRNVPVGQEALYADTVLELYERLAEERFFRSELQYAALRRAPETKSTPGKNWLQQEIGKEKAKLAKGMARFFRVK